MQRIAITGSSGYFGRKLVEYIRSTGQRCRILGIDVVPPRSAPTDEFHRLDIRSPETARRLEEFQPDTVVHFAFVVNPIRDNRLMRDINIGGLQNVLDAVQRIRPRRFLAASSATVYGTRPGHAQPLDERAELRACRKFRYSADKLELERRLAEFEAAHPHIAVSWVRPCMVHGPGVDNYLSRLLLHIPFVCLLDGNDTPLQFVHEDDLVSATWTILQHGGRGAFNVSPPDWVHASDMALESGRRAVNVPYWIVNLVAHAWWHLRLPVFNCPPPLYGYLRDPWIIAPRRLTQELGFEFRYSSRDTLRDLLQANGKLARTAVRTETAISPQTVSDAARYYEPAHAGEPARGGA